MSIDNLTFGEIKQLMTLFGSQPKTAGTLNTQLGQKVIIRTYSAGVFFGTLSEKDGNEVILTNARRLWTWKAKESISLSAVALHGIDESNSKIAEAVPSIWLQSIEIIPCSDIAIKSIEGAKNVKAQ